MVRVCDLDSAPAAGSSCFFERCARSSLHASGNGDHAEMVSVLPQFTDHADPFDRVMVAQALTDSLHLLTADGKLPRYHASLSISA